MADAEPTVPGIVNSVSRAMTLGAGSTTTSFLRLDGSYGYDGTVGGQDITEITTTMTVGGSPLAALKAASPPPDGTPNVALLGGYMASAFAASGDGYGMTGNSEPPTLTDAGPVLAPSRHG